MLFFFSKLFFLTWYRNSRQPVLWHTCINPWQLRRWCPHLALHRIFNGSKKAEQVHHRVKTSYCYIENTENLCTHLHLSTAAQKGSIVLSSCNGFQRQEKNKQMHRRLHSSHISHKPCNTHQSASFNQAKCTSGLINIHFSWNFYNFSTDMSAIFVWLKPCLTSIECWLPAKMSQVHRCKTSYSRSERKF